MKPKLTLLIKNQYGYQTDYEMYSRYLRKYFEIHYFCMDEGKPRIQSPDVKVSYIADKSISKLKRLWVFIRHGFAELANDSIVLAKYFPGVSLLRLSSNSRRLVIDVRSLTVSGSWLRRSLLDFICQLELAGHKNVNVVSERLARKLAFTKAKVVGLGCIPQTQSAQAYTKITGENRLIYLGSLDGRGLEILLKGVSLAAKSVDFVLDIVGSGNSKEKLISLAKNLGLEDVVNFRGYKARGEELSELMSQANLGIVHVPPTKQYAPQPSTKMFEYWSFGLPVLCSNYPSASDFIVPGSGLLYDFSPESIAQTIEDALSNPEQFDYHRIDQLAKKYKWEVVVKEQLFPILEPLILN